jgi:murein DD-endopeptidase MepM/ murein hydrolase activator NlpD
MALTRAQLQTAQLIMGLARQGGLNPARARELAAASYAESGLTPTSVNKSSGAAGLFQLLSSGYRSKAQQLGGLFNPRANTLAILPDYQRYWQQHPGAAPGEAGRDVERSGRGAGFYSRPLGLLGGVPVGGGGIPPEVPAAGGGGPPSPAFASGAAAIRNLVIRNMLSGQPLDPTSIAQTMQQAVRQRARSIPVGPTARMTDTPPTDKSGNFVDPVTGKVIGTPYHGTHTLGNWESDRALDIAVPIGTPIRAPFGGVVGSQFGSLGADPSSRFGGLRLHIASPENEWYGAHLSRFAPGIKPGRRVRPGQVVGYSGSASGVAHLHEALRSGDPYSLIR